MSSDEDTELRDLVAQTLETNGVLGKIRAQLRASVFLALEEQESVQNKTPFLNQELKNFLNTQEGRIVTSFVKEFLEYFNLDYTLAVFEPEAGIQKDTCMKRSELAREVDIIESDANAQGPLLAEFIKKGGRSRLTSGTEGKNQTNVSQDLTQKQINEARKKFEDYDEDGNGTIDKDELRQLFCDIFPNFHKQMLDRYVNDEFRAADKDFSNTIDFEEFLAMYKRLFVLCKSSVDVTDLTLHSSRKLSDSSLTSPRSKIPSLKKHNSSPGILEHKNKKNAAASGDKPIIEPKAPSRSISFGSEDEDNDPFFDDPLPKQDPKSFNSESDVSTGSSSSAGKDSGRKSVLRRFKKSKEKSTVQNAKPSNIPKPGATSPSTNGMSSLSGLPSINPQKSSTTNSSVDKDSDGESEMKSIDKKMTDLGFEIPPDDNYDDEDFESSNISPIGTARSQKSTHDVKSIEEDIGEDIEEDIEEDLSVGDDLLGLDDGGMDDLTTDRTVSPTDQSNAFDYIEDLQT